MGVSHWKYLYYLGFNSNKVIENYFDSPQCHYNHLIRKLIVAKLSFEKRDQMMIIAVVTIDKQDFEFAAIYLRESLYKDYTPYSSFPIFKRGSIHQLKVQKKKTTNNIEGMVIGTLPSGDSVGVYCPLYFNEEMYLTEGRSYEFTVTAFVSKINILEEGSGIESESEILYQWRESNPFNNSKLNSPVNLDERIYPYIGSDSIFPEDVTFCCIVKFVEKVIIENEEIFLLTVNWNMLDENNLNLLCDKRLLPKGIRQGDTISGWMHLMGRLSANLKSSSKLRDTPFEFGKVKPPKIVHKPTFLEKAILDFEKFSVSDFLYRKFWSRRNGLLRKYFS